MVVLQESPFPKSRDEAQTRIDADEIRFPMLAATLAGPVLNKLASAPEQVSIGHKIANKVGERLVRKSSSVDRALSEEQEQTVARLDAETVYWHGTGRYQYQEDGSVTDILRETLEHGLVPNYDGFDPIVGSMHSISLATARMYSRAYADMHGKGEEEPERHGSSKFWAEYFMGSCAISGAMELKPFTKSGRQKLSQFNQNVGESPMHWWDKVHSSTWGIVAPFKFGSDIEGNYPILIGVKHEGVKTVDTADAIGIHEVRSSEPISVGSFTHIEVPEDKITETQAVLAELGMEIPVVAIEDFEAHMATKPFLELVRPASAIR